MKKTERGYTNLLNKKKDTKGKANLKAASINQ